MPRAKKKRNVAKRANRISDEDDVPLKQLVKNDRHSENPNSYYSLCKPFEENCEFCEYISKNRYASLIHNVKHIIIPLLNQTVQQCEMCLYWFTSTEDLVQHQSKKHSLIGLVAQTDLVKNSFNNPQDESYESDFITIVKNDCDSNLEEKVKIKNEISETVNENSETVNENSETVNENSETVNENFKKGSSLKSRLMFEEDLTAVNNVNMLHDFTVSCRVSVELLSPVEEFPKSVHYDQLLSPGVYKCKKCVRMFPNRYDLILHETEHIVIANSQVSFCNKCNKYIAGDYSQLKHHKITSHYYTDQQNGGKTDKNGGNFDNENGGIIEKQNGVDCYSLQLTNMKLCNICYSFCKNRYNVSYQYVRNLCEIGKQFTCERCSYKFSQINLVKRVTKLHSLNRTKLKEKFWTKRKVLSNEERLKIIKRRLKMMKKIYFVVSFLFLISCLNPIS